MPFKIFAGFCHTHTLNHTNSGNMATYSAIVYSDLKMKQFTLVTFRAAAP